MSKLISTRVTNKFYKEFKRLVELHGYLNESDALRHIVRREIEKVKKNGSESS